KDGIKVGRDHDRPASFDLSVLIIVSQMTRVVAGPDPGCQHVTYVIGSHRAEIQFPELLLDVVAAPGLFEWRRGNLANRDEFVVRESVSLFQEVKSSPDLRRRNQVRYGRNRIRVAS